MIERYYGLYTLFYRELKIDGLHCNVTPPFARLTIRHLHWLIDNNLFVHEGKTECMLFGTGPKLALSTSFSIAIDGKALNHTSEYNYLGVVLDASLAWNAT